MKRNCPFSEKILDFWLQKPLGIDDATNEHLKSCAHCTQLYSQISAWSSDRAEENAYLTQKVMAKVSLADLYYSRKNLVVARFAFSLAILIGVVFGYYFTLPTTTELPNNEPLISDYRQQIKGYSSETYYDELKTEETQQLLTDLNN